jgi:hypothetical protein
MTSGAADAILWSWLALTPAAAAATGSADARSLLASLAREPPQSIAFAEIHSSPLLERELVVTGTLEYTGTGKLSRIVTAPHQERTDIDGDEVRIQREGRPERRFSLRRAPELGRLLTAFSTMLGGDQAALEREFELEYAVAADGWQLELLPRGGGEHDRIGSLRVRGSGDLPACIVVMNREGGVISELLLGAAATDPDRARQRALHCGALP